MSSIGRFEEPEREQDISEHGTHTIPAKYWTMKPGTNCLNDPAFRARRLAKAIRHAGNKIAKADENRRRAKRH